MNLVVRFVVFRLYFDSFTFCSAKSGCLLLVFPHLPVGETNDQQSAETGVLREVDL